LHVSVRQPQPAASLLARCTVQEHPAVQLAGASLSGGAWATSRQGGNRRQAGPCITVQAGRRKGEVVAGRWGQSREAHRSI
jgi:hypothetical protein